MSTAESSSVASMEEDWSHISEPHERRKIQNRIAQRKFREKMRKQREDTERRYENEQRAAGAYNAPDPEDLADAEESGLPWGGISMRHVIRTGKDKEKSSRETSLYAAGSKVGGSSRLGLHLCEEYARGCPAWAAWRTRTSSNAPPPPSPALMLGSNV